MWAMAMKEFRQMRRDRRTLAMMILLPVLLLVASVISTSLLAGVANVAARWNRRASSPQHAPAVGAGKQGR